MNKSLSIAIVFLLLTACAEKREGELKPGLFSNFLNITDNEDRGIKKILAFYGGYCEYGIGASSSTSEGKKKYFNLKLSKSSSLEEYKTNAQLPASNTAYLFYNKLRQERNDYDEIHVTLIFTDMTQETFEFPTKELELIQSRIRVIDKIVAFIKAKNFEGLRPMLVENQLLPFDKNKIISSLEAVDSQFGNVTEGLRLFGFKVFKTKYAGEMAHISGAIIRNKQNNAFSVNLSLNSNNDNAYSLDYQL